MWGREMRAGLVFVLVSIVAGGAFREWRRAHTTRFEELVASLVEAGEDASNRAGVPATWRGGAADGLGGNAADTAASADQRGTASTQSRRARAAALAPRPSSIDVDRASALELERLPGIGPSLAARIVAEREAHGGFGGPDGLLRVKGIGAKTLEKIRPYLKE